MGLISFSPRVLKRPFILVHSGCRGNPYTKYVLLIICILILFGVAIGYFIYTRHKRAAAEVSPEIGHPRVVLPAEAPVDRHMNFPPSYNEVMGIK